MTLIGIIIFVYLLIIIILSVISYRLYHRIYQSWKRLSDTIDQMIYVHGGYLYDLRKSGFDVNQIDRRFNPKTQWIWQTSHQSMDFVKLYQSLKSVGGEIMSQTGIKLFDSKLTQDTDMMIQKMVSNYTLYQKIRKIMWWISLGIYKLFDVYRV